MLISVLVNNSFQESFKITFMKKKKKKKNSYQFFFSFLIKTFFNWIVNQYPKDTRQYDPKFLNIFMQKFLCWLTLCLVHGPKEAALTIYWHIA